MTSAEWLATLPPGTPQAFTPTAVRQLCDLAIVDAQELVRNIKLSFAGTLPPPPWPATPELLDAMRRLRMVGDGLEVLERKGVRQLAPNKIPRLRAETAKAGSDLYQAMWELEKRWTGAKENQRVAARLFEFGSSGPLLALAALLYLDRRG